MKSSYLFFPLSILLLNNFILIFCATILNSTTDKDALVSFKSSITSDPRAILGTNWSENTSVCSWIGVKCGVKHRRVIALNLSGYDLAGTVAPHLGNLTFLRYLDISSNNFTTSLPLELSKLRHLKVMNVGANSFIGEIPTWLGRLPRLEQLYLSNNTFSGRIPASLFNNSKLEILNVSFNSLSGNIPKEIGRSSSLKEVRLSYNHLSGNIPQEISNISSLRILVLDANDLSGPIPHAIFNMSSLRELQSRNNSLSGWLPNDMCNNLPNLVSLVISMNQIYGEIPRDIWKCRELDYLELSINQFNGKIPSGIGSMRMLTKLFLGVNNLLGGIPSELGNLSRLETLSIRDAFLTGNIPSSIFNISSLRALSFSNNSLSGSIPSFHGIPKLEVLDLNHNKLTGELPQDIGTLPILELCKVSNNFLYGFIPSSISNLSSLKRISLSFNEFSGSLPSYFGHSLFSLEMLLMSGNKLSGPIPTSITNISKLTHLDIGQNLFSGFMPNFGDLRLLSTLFISENNLSGAESPTHELTFLSSLTNCRYLKKLEVSINPLNGILPSSVGNFSTYFEFLSAFNCSIKGRIPSTIGNLSSLLRINFSINKLSGPIPPTLGKLKKLQVLYLRHNQLVGFVPNELCSLNNLGVLYLGYNMLEGPIPECLGEVKSLREIYIGSNRLDFIPLKFWTLTDILFLEMSSNHFRGPLQPEIGNLKGVNYLDLSLNEFSGDIPISIVGCQSLEFLNLSDNHFNGSIPKPLGNVRGLRTLDLSYNNLSGSIPDSLQDLKFLEQFNVSNNKLEGKIPDGGVFGNFSPQSFVHNFALCGSTRFQVKPCTNDNGGSKRMGVVRLIKYVVPSFVFAVIVVIGILVLIRKCITKNLGVSAEVSPMIDWRRISYLELERGTNGFSERNLLGRGSYGSVFEATLSNGLKVAVKVFNLQVQGAVRSFETETGIMSNIHHRNLVRVIGCCSNSEFKALILTYMPNGSLEEWLYSDEHCLDLMPRINIAIDVAAAMEYLHHGYTFPVVHCDIKPSNVLLDEDMIAHLADFGIAKLFEGGESFVQTQTLATMGYAAPELGTEGRVSIKGDVYSFGIMLLEMFTGKKPTDDMFDGERSLKEWVAEALHENRANEIVEASLLSREDQHFSAKDRCVSSIFELAMKCLAVSANERTNMTEASATLRKIKEAFVAATERRRRCPQHFLSISIQNDVV